MGLNSNPVGITIAGSSPCPSLLVISAKAQIFDQVKINSTSQLIRGIFKLHQKLLKYFRGITSFAFVNESLFCGVFSYNICIYGHYNI